MRDNKRVVLYLEDDAHARADVTNLLKRRQGCEVLGAGDTQTAEKLLRENVDVIDVILADHKLGMATPTSAGFLTLAKKTLPKVPRILLSDSLMEEIISDFEPHGLTIRDVISVNKTGYDNIMVEVGAVFASSKFDRVER